MKYKMESRLSNIDVCITVRSFDDFAYHLHTNTIGPILFAQTLLKTGIPIGTIAFMSSDSGSAERFLDMEDG